MALITDISLSVKCDLSKDLDLTDPVQNLRYTLQVQLTSGTGAGKADMLFDDTREIAASSSEDLDLVGSLVDPLGTTFSPARIKAIVVRALSTNTNNVVIGAAAGTQWAALLGTTGTITLRPGAFTANVAGVADATAYACAAGSTDLLKVANSGAGSVVRYDIILVGASA